MGTYFGYLHIHTFQETTFQEVKDILAQWQAAALPLRGVILDLRGNSGGLFKSALAVAELFLPESVIAHTLSPLPDLTNLTKTYNSQNMAPFPLPMVVVVDGETASAAEVLAGALKDNQRAVLVGQPTYGKGSIQCVIPLERAPGGLRLTVAKFTTPSRVPFSGRGLAPDYPIEDDDPENVLKAAEQILRSQLMMMLR
jgi:carboxyl-terminal processing protease